ncbi:GTPase [Campylobacter magnus]|uniref:GTPase n=1 Tax=Campylobacter magnus TaxID=3026462 RepID=UPI0026E10150|nr:GTPase [Campylobacter magnus]MDO2408338.1 50S ribosome-binding GTPase [Campylobacter magnus]
MNKMQLAKDIEAKMAEFRRVKENSFDSTSKIVVFGLYNHGKSTLLNQLIGDYNNGTFKVADTRETIEEKRVDIEDKEYIDTPGLNADNHDTKTALDTISISDLYLFVHKVTTGELNQQEANFLKEVSKNLDANDFLKSCIFVLTCAKEVDESALNNVTEKIKKQLQVIFSSYEKIDINIISVDSKSFAKGKLEHKNLLADSGNIDKLSVLIKERLSKLDTKRQRMAKLRNMASEISKEIDEIVGIISQDINGRLTEYNRRKNDFDRNVARYNSLKETL